MRGYTFTNMKDIHLYWTERERSTVLDGKIFTIERAVHENPDGRTESFTLVDSPDWANVIAVVKDEQSRDCFLMARQYRHGGACLSLEFPGGMVDEGETAEEAAARELAEEAGFGAKEFRFLGATNPNPAFMTNTVSTFFAVEPYRLHADADRNLDENEIIDLELVPVDEILKNPPHEFVGHGIMLVAMYWYQQAGRPR